MDDNATHIEDFNDENGHSLEVEDLRDVNISNSDPFGLSNLIHKGSRKNDVVQPSIRFEFQNFEKCNCIEWFDRDVNNIGSIVGSDQDSPKKLENTRVIYTRIDPLELLLLPIRKGRG